MDGNWNQALRDARKWLAIGTGVGIEAGPRHLNVVVARVRPSGVRILGSLTIHDFRNQPASEWGAVYANFLAKLGVGYLSAVAVVRRDEVTVRPVPLPGVARKDIDGALQFQMDSLHPYPETDPVSGWARIGKPDTVLVGIARRATVDYYTTLFAEAGVKLAALTFSAAAFYGASRLLSYPPAEGFLALEEMDGQTEVYGESEAHGIFSALIHAPAERARGMALSELRLNPEMEPTNFAGVFPAPAALPDDFDLSRNAVPYAAALAGACPRLALPLNLLPPEQRQSGSRAIFIPTAVLASVVLLLAAALGISGAVENHRYKSELQQQIQSTGERALRVQAIDRKIADARQRIQTLDAFRMRSKSDMDMLADVTKALPPPTWLRSLDLTAAQLDIFGDTDHADTVVKSLDQIRGLSNSEFAMPLTRAGAFETFRIRSQRKGTGK
jgi:Tfp pilus assembly protein PilN